MKHKLTIYCLTTILLLGVLSGCGRRETEVIPPDATPIAINYITFNASGEAEDAAIEKFEETNPHLEFDTSTYNQLPISYIRSENPPDIMLMIPSYFLDEVVAEGVLTDLTEVWQETGLTDTMPPGVQALSTYDGKQYLLPIGVGWTGIYYNREIFDQFGFEPPSTWDELMIIADTLLSNGITPFALAGDSGWHVSIWFDYLNLRMNGPEFRRALISGEIDFEDSRVTDVLEMFQFLLLSGYFLDNAVNMSENDAVSSVIRGDNGQLATNKAVMMLGAPDSDFPQKFRDELDFFRFPIIDPTLPVGEIATSFGYMIPSNAPNRIEVLRYLAFLGSDEIKTVFTQEANVSNDFVPANPDMSIIDEDIALGLDIIQSADDVSSSLFFSIPFQNQGTVSRNYSSYLRNVQRGEPGDILEFQATLDRAYNGR